MFVFPIYPDNIFHFQLICLDHARSISLLECCQVAGRACGHSRTVSGSPAATQQAKCPKIFLKINISPLILHFHPMTVLILSCSLSIVPWLFCTYTIHVLIYFLFIFPFNLSLLLCHGFYFILQLYFIFLILFSLISGGLYLIKSSKYLSYFIYLITLLMTLWFVVCLFPCLVGCSVGWLVLTFYLWFPW